MLERVLKNIVETVGVEYEIITIDNSDNKYSICEAYNIGGKKAVFPFLCFMHEDICFDTPDWGHIVCSHLDNQKVGLIGVAGGDTKSIVPSSWSVPFKSNEINIIQHYKRSATETEHVLQTNPVIQSVKKRVVALDGVWLCTKKSIFKEFQFDENTFKGFHGYDIDYSLQVGQKFDVYVVFDILIHHFSEGTPDRKWIDSAFLISKKWAKKLPVSVYTLSSKDVNIHYYNSLQVLIKHLLRLNYSYWFILTILFQYSFTAYFNTRKFFSLVKYLSIEMNNHRQM